MTHHHHHFTLKDLCLLAICILFMLAALTSCRKDYELSYPIGTYVVYKHYSESYQLHQPLRITALYERYNTDDTDDKKKDYNYYTVEDMVGKVVKNVRAVDVKRVED